MGTTAEKIARHVAAQAKAPVIDLAGHRLDLMFFHDHGYAAYGQAWFTGETFLVQGGQVTMIESWKRGAGVERDSKWTVGELADALAPPAHP